MSSSRGSAPEDSFVFISYSHLNSSEKDKLLTQFGALKFAQVKATAWADSYTGAGEDWRRSIEEAMARCDAAVLLITDCFLDSEFIQTVEVPRLLERRQKEQLAVVPVLAQDCAWQLVPWLERMQMRPKGALPVWREKGSCVDPELTAIVLEVHKLVKQAQERREQAKLEAKERAQAEQEAAAKYNAVQKMIDENRNAFLIALAPGEAGTQEQQMDRWRMLQEDQAKMFKTIEDVIMNRNARNKEMMDKWEKLIRSTE